MKNEESNDIQIKKNGPVGGRQGWGLMRLAYFIFSFLSISIWLCILWIKIGDFVLISCARSPNASFKVEVFFYIIFPIIMIIASLFMMLISIFDRNIRLYKLFTGVALFIFAPIYFMAVPNIIVDNPECLMGAG